MKEHDCNDAEMADIQEALSVISKPELAVLNTIKSERPRLELTNFDPRSIPFQYRALYYIRKEHDYSLGVATVLLSGAVGSSKSSLVAHMVVTHILENPGAQAMVLRRSMGLLKSTIWFEILNHYPELKKYWNKSEMKIYHPNGSIIHGVSYADGDYEKFKSYTLSFIAIEEATECEDKSLFDNLMERLRRIHFVKENVFLLATNPDGPGHWIYKHLIAGKRAKVFYSVTSDNPFMDPVYVEGLRRNLCPKRAMRQLEGKWVDLHVDGYIYLNYTKERNFREFEYVIKPRIPIAVCFDFNVGIGKPFSASLGQHVNGTFHTFKAFLLKENKSTQNMLNWISREGWFENYQNPFYAYGDQTGNHNDTRSNQSDWDIIESFLRGYRRKDGSKLEFSIELPSCNPPLKRRHNLVNSLCLNAMNETRFYIYQGAEDADEGFRLTRLKKNSGTYIEDDGPLCPWQHVTTAIGYWVDYVNEYGSSDLTITIS